MICLGGGASDQRIASWESRCARWLVDDVFVSLRHDELGRMKMSSHSRDWETGANMCRSRAAGECRSYLLLEPGFLDGLLVVNAH